MAVGRTADDHLGEAFPPYAIFRTHVGRLDEFVHLAAFDPAGRAADTLRRSGFVLLWTAFDAFVRDTLAALVERDPAALLAAAGDAAVPYDELLELERRPHVGRRPALRPGCPRAGSAARSGPARCATRSAC